MSAVTARGTLGRLVASPGRADRGTSPAIRRQGSFAAVAHRLIRPIARGVEPSSTALALSDPEQIRRLVLSARLVEEVRWGLVLGEMGRLPR